MRSTVLRARMGRPVAAYARRPRRPGCDPLPQATRVVLVQHGTDQTEGSVLVGRRADIGLSEQGHLEARRLARILSRKTIARVQSSPRPRALETAKLIAQAAKAPLDISFALDDLDYGAWTGLSVNALANDPAWTLWNTLRSLARPPDGETMQDLQRRVLRHLAGLRVRYPGAKIVLVTHPDVIRAAVLRARRLSIDTFANVNLDPCAAVALRLERRGAALILDEEQD